MNDPQRLIDIARQLDPTMADPEQALIDALVIAKALDLLEPVMNERNERDEKEERLSAKMKRLRAAKKEKAEIRVPMVGDTVKQLKQFIKKHNLRLSAVARSMDISVASIHAWFGKKWTPSDRYVARIHELISKSEEELGPLKIKPPIPPQ